MADPTGRVGASWARGLNLTLARAAVVATPAGLQAALDCDLLGGCRAEGL